MSIIIPQMPPISPQASRHEPVMSRESRTRRTLTDAIRRGSCTADVPSPQSNNLLGRLLPPVSPSRTTPYNLVNASTSSDYMPRPLSESPQKSRPESVSPQKSRTASRSPQKLRQSMESPQKTFIEPPMIAKPIPQAAPQAVGVASKHCVIWNTRMFVAFEHEFARIEHECAENTLKPIANLCRLYEVGVEACTDSAGLKRFDPLGLEKMKPRPGSELPDYERVTPFHSCAMPPMPLHPFVLELARQLRLPPGVVAAATVLFDRFDQRCRAQNDGMGVTSHMMHRLMSACLLVSHKTQGNEGRIEVSVFRQLTYLVRLDTREIAGLERTLLEALGWRTTVFFADLPLGLRILFAS